MKPLTNFMKSEKFKKYFLNNAGFMKYFKNTSWLFMEKILRMCISFIVGVWVARYLGPNRFGLLSYAQAFVGLFIAFSTLGLDWIIVRELVKNENRNNILLGTAFILKLIGAIIVLILLAVAMHFTHSDTLTKILVFIVGSAAIFQSFNVIDFYFQSKVLSQYIVFSQIFSLVLSSILKIFLILNNSPLIYFAWVILFDSFILALGLWFFYHRKYNSIFHWRFSKNTAFELLKTSWPLIFGSIAVSIYMKIDQVMIKEIIGSDAAGYYAVSAKLTDLWLVITVVTTKSLLPSIIKAKEQSEELFLYRMQYLYNILIKIAFFISVIMSLFSGYIIETLYGLQYLNSIPIFHIYIWSIIFVYLSNISGCYFLAENMQLHTSIRLIIGAIINVILNIYWIKLYGLTGAAYATLVSYAISSYFYNLIVSKRTRKNFKLQTKALFNIFNFNSYREILKMR